MISFNIGGIFNLLADGHIFWKIILLVTMRFRTIQMRYCL